jgi:HlyD family secretion protein
MPLPPAAAAAEPPSWRLYAWLGYALIGLTFGGLGGIACFARIDSAVVAPAVVTVESLRKTVQHLEGGIIAEVLVHEGEAVRQGQNLFRLSDVQPHASVELLRAQLIADLALQERLQAERALVETVPWPGVLAPFLPGEPASQAIADQSAQFQERRRSLRGQEDILEARIAQLQTEIEGIRIEHTATETQLGYIRTELAGVLELYAQKLVQLPRVMALQRERARLEGTIGRLIADAAKAGRNIAEIRLDIDQLREKFREEDARALTEVRQRIGETREKLTVADDVLRRSYIAAPIAGSVQGLRVGGSGQVIRQGEPLLDIVPTDYRLQISARFDPNDIADLRPGQQVEIRFPAFYARTTPLLLGRLESVSRDRLVEEGTGQPYFLGLITTEQLDIPPDLRGRIRAGMPAEVVVPLGERTIISYLVSPLSQSLRRTFIEK